MSNTHCRYCDITVQGLYINCPRCGKYLAPGEGLDTPSEPFQIIKYGDSWQTAQPQGGDNA